MALPIPSTTPGGVQQWIGVHRIQIPRAVTQLWNQTGAINGEEPTGQQPSGADVLDDGRHA